MWIPDLSLYFEEDAHFLAVGFLCRDHPFPTGDVSTEFFSQLCALASNPWSPPYAVAGFHNCDICRFTNGGTARFGHYNVSSQSNRELFIPGDGVIYVAPISIPHYIDAHQYLPPAVFLEAVMQCPPMRSMQYLKALLENGARELIRGHSI